MESSERRKRVCLSCAIALNWPDGPHRTCGGWFWSGFLQPTQKRVDCECACQVKKQESPPARAARRSNRTRRLL